MKLTERRKQFLQQIIGLYEKSGLPVHYVMIANLLGVSKWTAYDMFKELEKSGFLKRDYVVTPKVLGRSVIVFSPTNKAEELFGQPRQATLDAGQLNGLKKKILERIFELQTANNLLHSLEFILNEVAIANVRIEFCMYIVGIFVLYLHALGKDQKDMVKNIIMPTDRHDIKITLFVGMVLGSMIQSVAQEFDPRIGDLIGSFLKYLDQLDPNEMQILIEFLEETLEREIYAK